MSDALAAALMMQQRGQQQFDPAENSRRFARMLMQQGSSTAPVQSWGEGLARALTGVAGGVFEGMGRRDQEEKNQKLIEGLTAAYGAPDEASRMAALKGLGGDGSGVLAPFLASMLSQKVADERKFKILDTKLDAAGVSGGGAPATGQSGLGGPNSGPLTIDINKPLPSGAVTPSSFNNNVGNIRAGATPWEGKGAPQNGFETFGTPQQGVNAAFKNLQYYVKQNPNMTVAQAIAQWAPPKENNTELYIRQVAEGTGINPGMPLAEVMKDPAVAATLLDAITRKEKGGLPQGVTADTFMAATGGGGFTPTNTPAQSVAGGLPQMPPQTAQGSTEMAPQHQQAPVAQPQPQMPETSPAAQALLQQAQQARAGGDRERALALAQKAQEAQAAYVQERAKTQDTRSFEQGKTAEERAYKEAQERTKTTGPQAKEYEQLRLAKSEGAAIINALEDFKKEFPKKGLRSLTGSATPANVSYNTAALLAKGEALFNLGVLNGPDLDIIRKTLPDPSTISGQMTTEKDMVTAVDKITNLINARIAAKEKALGLEPSAGASATAQPQAAPAGPPQVGTVMDGYRFKGGDPSKQENWERAQ